MASICYSDTKEPFTGRQIRIDLIDPHPKWETHFANHCFLSFVQRKSQDRNERAQATKELAICERKMNWWERHPLFNKDKAFAIRQKVLATWKE
jgi:hypothetical protein